MGIYSAQSTLGIWQVICDGNSLTAGVGTTPYPAQLETLSSHPVINKGEPGWTTPQLTARFDATIPPLFLPQYRRSVAVLWEATNDIILNNVSGATAWANFVALCNKYILWQCPFVVLNIIARGNFTVANRTAADEFNVLMAANWRSIGATSFCDVASVFNDYTDATKYNFDQIHLTTAGNTIVAAMVNSCLADLWTSTSNDALYSIQGGAPGTVLGDTSKFWRADGSWATPIERPILPLDTTYSPVGLWDFTGGPSASWLNDLSGNGYTLSLAAGTLRYSWLTRQLRGLALDGATALYRNANDAPLAIVGDMSLLWLGSLADFVLAGATVQSIVLHTGIASDVSDTYNVLYALQNNANSLDVAWEYTGGVNVTYSIGGVAVLPGQPFLLGFRRASNVVQGFINGLPFGSASTTLAAPTGGSAGRLVIGASQNTTLTTWTNFMKGMVSSMAIYNTALSDANMLERFRHCFG